MDIVREAVRQIESEGEPQAISQDVTIEEAEDIPTVEVHSINLLDQMCTPFVSLQRQAPKDRFIEWAVEQANPIIEQAVAITYTGLPQELWGSDKAQEMIAGLLERHREK
jgi:hypothetical protein